MEIFFLAYIASKLNQMAPRRKRQIEAVDVAKFIGLTALLFVGVCFIIVALVSLLPA